jgi:hypothetical protein
MIVSRSRTGPRSRHIPDAPLAISTGAMLNAARGVSSFDVRAFYETTDGGDLTSGTWTKTYTQPQNPAAMAGKLVTTREVQACFDDNEFAAGLADSNAANFRAQIASYYPFGIKCWSSCLEGGNPDDATGDAQITNPSWTYNLGAGHTSAFASDGLSLKAAHKARWEALIEALSANDMDICLGLFYGRQSGYLNTQTKYENAIRTATTWLIEKGYRNVIIDVANESGADASTTWGTTLWTTDAGSRDMVNYTKDQWAGQPWRPPVGCSSRSKPGALVLAASDVHYLHGNVAGTPAPGNRDNWANDIIAATTAGPVVCNEDETQAEENGGATQAKLDNELVCFRAMNNIAGVSGGTMHAKPDQRWSENRPNGLPFGPEIGATADLSEPAYWPKWANWKRGVFNGYLADTGGLT